METFDKKGKNLEGGMGERKKGEKGRKEKGKKTGKKKKWEQELKKKVKNLHFVSIIKIKAPMTAMKIKLLILDK